jgi:hypothetical protein
LVLFHKIKKVNRIRIALTLTNFIFFERSCCFLNHFNKKKKLYIYETLNIILCLLDYIVHEFKNQIFMIFSFCIYIYIASRSNNNNKKKEGERESAL